MKRVVVSLNLLLVFSLVLQSALLAQDRGERQKGPSMGNLLTGLGSSWQPRGGGSVAQVLLARRFPGVDGPNCSPRRDQISIHRSPIPSRSDQISIMEIPSAPPRMVSRIERPVTPPKMVSRFEGAASAGTSILALNLSR